jgi:hypothetical protein
MTADVLRYALAVLGLVLAVSSAGGGVYAATWDQGIRFLVMFGYSAITISGQLDNLGNPATWRTWALMPITLLAIISTMVFLIREKRGGRVDGRSPHRQRRLLRPGAAARRRRDPGHGAKSPHRGSAS